MMFTACLALALPKPERSNRSSGLIRNSYLLNKQMIIDNSWLGLANTQPKKGVNLSSYQDQREWLLTFGLGIIILQGVSSRKSLLGVNIMRICLILSGIHVPLFFWLTCGEPMQSHSCVLKSGDLFCSGQKLICVTTWPHIGVCLRGYRTNDFDKEMLYLLPS
jgi:hypothetical protein